MDEILELPDRSFSDLPANNVIRDNKGSQGRLREVVREDHR